MTEKKSILNELKTKGKAALFPEGIRIMVGYASCGVAAGADSVFEVFSSKLNQIGIPVVLKKTGCIGMCYAEPLVDIAIAGKGRFLYQKVTPEQVDLFVGMLKNGRFPEDAVAKLPVEGRTTPDGFSDIANLYETDFYRKQERKALRNCGNISPEDIEEYVSTGGYCSLQKILLKKLPEEVIKEVELSGLRGRGGAGYPTGLKWRTCFEQKSEGKYIICNADEGDPGAYMDRSILESDPHSVIEGMIIAAYSINADRGIIYVRDEYPLAIERLNIAIKQARQNGLLGDNILNSGFCFDISISTGAGAFVCGEETALIQSIEGSWGEPRQRPPYPAVSGLFGKPTVINNVETLSVIPLIIDKGYEAFSAVGTEKSKGTKVFSLVGKVARVGLIEVPMGTTLREIVMEIGGGVEGGRDLKAVQTGGPSGGCIPEPLMEICVDYEELQKTGSIMGSGGIIVMDETTCMVDLAGYFLEFLESESCGKCVPCRVGIRRMRQVVDKIRAGRAVEADIAALEEMGNMITASSLCGLGKTAPNPVLSTLRHFKNEYIEHISNRKCPAGVCKALIVYSVSSETCTGCGACIKVCPVQAITGEKKAAHSISETVCIKCGACIEVCPVNAIKAI